MFNSIVQLFSVFTNTSYWSRVQEECLVPPPVLNQPLLLVEAEQDAPTGTKKPRWFAQPPELCARHGEPFKQIEEKS